MHLEFHSKNKFEELVHLVGFIVRTNICITIYGKKPKDNLSVYS